MLVKTSDTNSWYMHDPKLPTPKSTTHESMEIGRKLQSKFRIIFRKQLNFQSYPMNDYHLDGVHFEKPFQNEVQSTYNREFTIPKAIICSAETAQVEVEQPDVLFNRKTRGEFEVHPWASTKFMDDHMVSVSPMRKKINFFRQMRYKSLVLP